MHLQPHIQLHGAPFRLFGSDLLIILMREW